MAATVNWCRIYDFASDEAQIKAIQRATTTTEDFGIVPEPALVGSEEWWRAIDEGALPHLELEGKIGAVYWGSMSDWPEFEVIAEDGGRTRRTREGDVARYVAGLRVRIGYVLVRHKKPVIPDPHSLTLTIDVEESRLRSCDVAPGPGGVGLSQLTTLYRPVGDQELQLIEESGHRRFPPRLPHQPIFYPVETEAYARRIASEWNTKDSNSGFAGFVTAFHVRNDFLDHYELHEAGGRALREYWIPAEDLDAFNTNLKGRIDVVAEFYGPDWQPA